MINSWSIFWICIAFVESYFLQTGWKRHVLGQSPRRESVLTQLATAHWAEKKPSSSFFHVSQSLTTQHRHTCLKLLTIHGISAVVLCEELPARKNERVSCGAPPERAKFSCCLVQVRFCAGSLKLKAFGKGRGMRFLPLTDSSLNRSHFANVPSTANPHQWFPAWPRGWALRQCLTLVPHDLYPVLLSRLISFNLLAAHPRISKASENYNPRRILEHTPLSRVSWFTLSSLKLWIDWGYREFQHCDADAPLPDDTKQKKWCFSAKRTEKRGEVASQGQ